MQHARQHARAVDGGEAEIETTSVCEVLPREPAPVAPRSLSAGNMLLQLALLIAPVAAWNVTVSLHDPSRKSLFHPHGRPVSAVVCGAVGDTTELPLYVWAHGFDCRAVDYAWLCDTPGMVSALVISSDISPFLPDTSGLAGDQAFLTTALPALAANKSSPLHGLLSGKAVLGGHSMGGGTSVLAADPTFAPRAAVDALALLAPGLYTLPPAYSHKGRVQAPLLVVSGATDCGPNQLPKEALPLYNGVRSTRKALVVLKGANHCQWSSPTAGGVCAHEECHRLDRTGQQEAGSRLLQAFLPAALGVASWDTLEVVLAAGAAAGEWSFVTMRTGSASNLTNDCPCTNHAP